MPIRESFMLDNMITVVEQGFSFDGVVSIPETGLEDVGYRIILASWVNKRVEPLLKALSKVVDKIVGKSRHPTNGTPTRSREPSPNPPNPPHTKNGAPSPTDSGVDAGEKLDNVPGSPSPPVETPAGHSSDTEGSRISKIPQSEKRQDSPSLPGARTGLPTVTPPQPDTKEDVRPPIQPRLLIKETQPRKDGRAVGDNAHQGGEQSPPQPGEEFVHTIEAPSSKDSGAQPIVHESPRLKRGRGTNQGSQPRKKDGNKEGTGGDSG